MKIVLQKSLWRILASIIFSLMMFSNSAYAELPKAIQADKYKLQISEALKNEKYLSAFNNIQKLEALKVKIPDSIIYYKGESLFHLKEFDYAKQFLEAYLNKTGSKGKYYKKSLMLLSKLDEDYDMNEFEKAAYGTQLHVAAAQGKVYRVKALLDDGYHVVDMESDFGKTPLFHAVAAGNYKVVKELVARGANVNHKDENKSTALHMSAAYFTYAARRYFEAAELLIKKGAGVNVKDIQGRTPLHYAVGNERQKLIKFLIKSGANLNVSNNKGDTPLDTAIKIRADNAITMLKKHGAKRGADL